MNPRQPALGRTPRRRWQFHQAPTRTSLGDAVGVSPVHLAEPPPQRPGGGSRPMPADALKCKECKTEYPLEARFVCERCFGPLEVSYTLPDADPAAIKRKIQAGPHTMWRYADFLPLEGPARSALPTGWTPLVKADRLAERLGIKELYIKNETANPTHSFKDRVVSVALARARELGFDTLACASHGQPRQRRRRPRRRGRAARLRADPARPRGAEDPRHRRLRGARSSPSPATTTTSTGSAPRSRASGRAGRS